MLFKCSLVVRSGLPSKVNKITGFILYLLCLRMPKRSYRFTSPTVLFLISDWFGKVLPKLLFIELIQTLCEIDTNQNLNHTRGITPKHVVRGSAPGRHSSEETLQRWQAVGDAGFDLTCTEIQQQIHSSDSDVFKFYANLLVRNYYLLFNFFSFDQCSAFIALISKLWQYYEERLFNVLQQYSEKNIRYNCLLAPLDSHSCGANCHV